jgi:histidinol dehydrogenase
MAAARRSDRAYPPADRGGRTDDTKIDGLEELIQELTRALKSLGTSFTATLAARFDDAKIDKLEKLLREQNVSTNEALNNLSVAVARVEERLDAFGEKTAENKKEIDGVKANQRWAALAIIGAFVTSVANFFFRGGD